MLLTPLYKAIFLHVILSVLFMYLRPEYFFNENGPKTFGTGKNCTPFPCYLITTIISSIAFLLWSIFPSTM